MKKEIFDIIVCPVCGKSEFKLQIDCQNELEIRDGRFQCENCRASFLIKKGIIFLFDKLSELVLKERAVLEEEIKQENLTVLRDENWLLNFPFNKQLGIDKRTDRMMRISANNTLIFFRHFNWPKKRIKILEIGAGNCWLAAKLAKNYETIALDILVAFPKGLETADVFIEQKNVFFERVVADMKNLPFKDKSFDIILFNAALHHSSDLEGTLKEVYRILSSDGQIILLNEPSVGWFGSQERKQIIQDVEKGIEENRYTIREWVNAFAIAGFKCKIYLPSNFLEVLRTKGRFFQLFNLLFKLIPSFLRKSIIDKAGMAVLTIFDGFFNAIIYKKEA